MLQDDQRTTDDVRLATLASYDILDTDDEAEFDEIVRAAAAACDVPISLVSFVDRERQWFKAAVGLDAQEVPISASICVQTLERRDLLVIPDTTQDPRTAANPLVAGAPHLRFYAGVPLETVDGVAIGTLCVLDVKPNQLNPTQVLILRTLARQTMTALELRRTIRRDRRTRSIIESAVDFGIVATDLSGRVTDWNTGAERIFGWSEAEMRGKPAQTIYTEEDVMAGVPEQEMDAALRDGRGADERWHRKKDNSRFWANGEIMPLKDGSGVPEGFIKILRDRTEQREAALRQREDAEFMRSVLASSADCIKVLDLDANLTFMNEGGMATMEISDFNDVRGCPWPTFWDGQGGLDVLTALEAAKAGGVGHFLGAANTYRGTPKWWDVQVTPILGEDGAPEKLLAVSRDISGQKAVEGRLAASESRWRGLFDGMQEGFILGELVRDANGRAFDYRFLETNPAFARQSGLPADCIGRTIRGFVPDIDQSLIDNYARVVETGEPIFFEIDVPALDRVFEVRAAADQADRFTCLFFDVTDRKRAEARRAATAELGDYMREAATVLDMTTKAAEIVGRTLGGSRAGYGELDETCENVTILGDGGAPGGTSIVGRHRFADYGAVGSDIMRGDPVVVPDVTTDPRTAGNADVYAAIEMKAMLNVPVQEHGRTVGLIFVHNPTARTWTPEEVAFARNVADRVQVGVARLRAEEQRAFLNRELAHRLKNTLAMVQSIATQTLRNAPDILSARATLTERIGVLSRAHDVLISGQRDAASVEDVVTAATALHDQGGRVRPSGPDVPLGPKASLTLALILHELATNAGKYGALSTEEGRVDIGWSVADDVETRRPTLTFEWRESGGPPVTPPTRTSFGSRLIGMGISGSAAGSSEIDYAPDGLVCRITASLTDLQADDQVDTMSGT